VKEAKLLKSFKPNYVHEGGGKFLKDNFISDIYDTLIATLSLSENVA
jgi:hypothetical protein